MKPVEVKPEVYWVGVVDWNIRDFHGYSTYKGTTYNAYLLRDEKIVLFDTVKKGFLSELLHRIRNLGIQPEDIDYLVVNHVEPDHSGSLPQAIERIRPEKIFCSPMGAKAIQAHYHPGDDWPLTVVKSGDSISLGRRSVTFLETRMLHWPDSMFSYIPEEKLLISSDAFGHHWATSERFDDQVDTAELMAHCAKYYANILLLYSPLVQKLLQKVAEMGLEIEVIAPDHGVIWRREPGRILAAYDRWSRQETTNKAVVVYDTMWHSTQTMAQAVADGLSEAGMSVQLMCLKSCHRSDVITELLEASVLAVGSPTLNNGMLPTVADFLCYLKGLKPKNKVAAAFGSYGWSGEAVKEITRALEDMKLEVLEGVRHQYVPDHQVLGRCRRLGQELAARAGG